MTTMSRKIFENKKDRERAMNVIMGMLSDLDIYSDGDYRRGKKSALNAVMRRFENNIIHRREVETELKV